MIKNIQVKIILVFFLVGVLLIGGLRLLLYVFSKFIK